MPTSVTIEFPDKDLSKPRWNFVNPSVFECEEFLSLGPRWLLADPKECFELDIRLEDSGAKIYGVELFDTTDGSNPVHFSLGEEHAVAIWRGGDAAPTGRWVYSLIVSLPGTGQTMPVHLTFATPLESFEKAARMSVGEVERQELELAISSPALPIEVTSTLKAGVKFNGQRIEFTGLFDLSKVALPHNVSLEPQIVAKGLGQCFTLEIGDSEGILAAANPTCCNPGMEGGLPLFLHWIEVNPGLPRPCSYPAAFCGSSLGKVRNAVDTLGDVNEMVGRLFWNQPMKDSFRRVSSFYLAMEVKDTGVSSCDGDGNSHTAKSKFKLIDPTIIHDPALPP